MLLSVVPGTLFCLRGGCPRRLDNPFSKGRRALGKSQRSDTGRQKPNVFFRRLTAKGKNMVPGPEHLQHSVDRSRDSRQKQNALPSCGRLADDLSGDARFARPRQALDQANVRCAQRSCHGLALVTVQVAVVKCNGPRSKRSQAIDAAGQKMVQKLARAIGRGLVHQGRKLMAVEKTLLAGERQKFALLIRRG